jgi:WD40 repeat protein
VNSFRTSGSGGPKRGDRDVESWAFESAVERALWWVLRATLGRTSRLILRLWRSSKLVRIWLYAGAGTLVIAGITFASVRTYENRHASIYVGPGAFGLSPRGDRFSIYTPKGIEIWNLETRRRIGTVGDGDQTLDFMSPDGRLLAGGVQHGEYPQHTVEDIRLRRTQDGSVVRVIDTAEDSGRLVWSPSGESIAVLTPDAIQVVRARDGRLLTSIRGYPPLANDPVPIVWAPDGSFLAIRGKQGGIALWDVTNGHYLRTLAGDFESGISFSPDGQLFAEGGTPVRLRCTTDGHLVRELRSREPSGPVYSSSVLAFSRDGDLLATGGADGKIRLWQVDSGKLLKVYSGHGYNETDHTSSVLAVAFFPDGRHIASHGSDETLRIWPVEERGP